VIGAVVLVVVAALAAIAAVVAVRSPQYQLQLVWSDEFDGLSGARPDPSRWGYDIGGTGWGNSELERYTDDAASASQDGSGNLAITVRPDTSGAACWYGTCRYTSARLTTANKFTTTYGRLEARIRLPGGQGIWPAFWTGGANIDQVGWPAAGEIDVMEHLGSFPSEVSGALHAPGWNILNSYQSPGGVSLEDDFHTFAVDWSPTAVTWLVDGVAYHTEDLDGRGAAGAAFGLPHYLLLNVAVGGSDGPPDASTSLPQTMLVDYVRVYSFGD
jgi:beta-glucanase (GH16 family)